MQGDDDRPLGFEEAPAHFESAAQIARVQTEAWASRWLFCPNCGSPRLGQFPNNSKVADFFCRDCPEQYELKSTAKPFGRKVPDGAYAAMQARLAAQDNPNLLLLRYDRPTGPGGALDLMVIPKQFFVLDVIERRAPLSPTARRAGWVGCNILLARIPQSGRIYLLKDRQAIPRADVRAQWDSTLFLRDRSLEARGWLLEVMKAVEAIRRPQFTLDDVYAAEVRLQSLFPANRNVRPKIRQQLQVLRDQGYLEFVGRGVYRLRAG
jgi:type II restriction enzyme